MPREPPSARRVLPRAIEPAKRGTGGSCARREGVGRRRRSWMQTTPCFWRRGVSSRECFRRGVRAHNLRLGMRTDTKQKTTLNAHTFGTVGKTREPQKSRHRKRASGAEKHETSRERISIGATHYARPRARSSHAADAFRAVRTRDPANMSSAAFASTSRLSHTARIGSSRHTDAPLRSFRSSGVAARHGRRATRVVAAVAEPGTVAAPLTKEDLVDYLRSGCKPKEQWRCVRGAVDPRPTTWPRAFPPPPKPLARRVSSREFPETRPSRPFLEQIKPRKAISRRRRTTRIGGTRRPASVALFVALFDRSARAATHALRTRT